MKAFFLSLFSSQDNSASSKRFVAVIGSFVIFIIALSVLYFSFVIPEFIFYGVLTFILSLFGLNTVITAKGINAKSKIASQMVDGTDGNEDAKEVLTADKP